MSLLLLALLAAPGDGGLDETHFEVVPRSSDRKVEVPSDEPAGIDLPVITTTHRDEGQAYLDPFLGREVFPELSAQLSMRFVQEKISNVGEPHGKDGRVALRGRVDVNLWVLDARVPFGAAEGENAGPVELVLKAPFSAGPHRFAPMVVFHVPTDRGLEGSLVELAFGYHYARDGFGLMLEVSGFSGTHDRRKGPRSAGMVGWDAVVSYLFGDVFGVVVEADGTTAISEHVESKPPSTGDTVVRLAPGFRFFPIDPGFSLGLAAVLTFVPDGYEGLTRDQGVLFDIGYTFL